MSTNVTRKPKRRTAILKDDLRPHYDFDRSKAKPNRFAGGVRSQTVVLLDPDVSRVFKDGESVNSVLRSLISTMPPARRGQR
jgi:hypothetical protein